MDKRKRKIIQKKGKHYSEMERHGIIREMLKKNWTKQFAWELYIGEPKERGQLMRWMRKLGYVKEIRHKKFTFDVKLRGMKKHQEQEKSETEPFETMQLKKRIAKLEKQLKDAEMKAIAYSTMVDIAEKKFNIPIKKKFNIKPSQK